MLDEKRTVTIGDKSVVLDTSKLQFCEGTLSEYLETEGGWIDYFGARLADAERELAQMEMAIEKEEDQYDRLYSKVFATIKDTEGGSDKLTETKAKVEPTVVAAKEKIVALQTLAIELKYAVRLIHQHLRAWDKNHENAQNRGNTLRKELERLNKDRVYEEVDRIIKPFDV